MGIMSWQTAAAPGDSYTLQDSPWPGLIDRDWVNWSPN